jgi:glycosyltransferase involved in cell wall biosynthesis
MKILLINHYAGSPQHGMEYRPYYLAREWIKLGHTVHIHAATYSHVRRCQPEAPGAQTIDGIHYHWWHTPAYTGNGLGRARNIWAFLKQLWCASSEIVQHASPDIVIASSTYPLDIWVARRIAKLARAKLVYEVHDLWPASPIELSHMSPHHPFMMLCQKAENDAYRYADNVVSMLPKVAPHMASHGLSLERLHIIPNGIALEDWGMPPEPLNAQIASHIQTQKTAGRYIVGYAGSQGLPNALHVLLEAAATLKNEPIAFILIGDGHEHHRLVHHMSQLQLTNAVMFPPIPKSQIPSLLAHFDVAYIGWKRTPIYRFGIAPNKLMDYMMAGCAVLHSVCAGNDPVQDAQCGISVEPESPSEVVQGLRTLLALPAKERQKMGQRGRAYILANHTYTVLAARFIQALT